MCGIVGYIGEKKATPILLDALEKLEYRGYDSAGIALVSGKGINIFKTRGRIADLRKIIDAAPADDSCVGIGHTRWATHGEPSDLNAHPHRSKSGRVAVVHNGIVENYLELRQFLIEHGHSFSTETDSEVVSELIDYCYNGDPVAAVRIAESKIKGSYSFGILFKDYPWQIIAMRKDSPLIIGAGRGENFIASDVPAILKHTRDVYRLGERELAILTKDGVTVINSYGERVNCVYEHIDWDASAAEKCGYPHFMIKEIMEQPEAIAKTIAPRISNGRIELGFKHITAEMLKKVNSIKIIGCGSAYHVGFVAGYFMRAALSQGLVERDVIRVITPGTVIETQMLNDKENNYIAAVYLKRAGKNPSCSIAYSDVSTGEFCVTSFEGSDISSDLFNELVGISPRELIANSEMFEDELLLKRIKARFYTEQAEQRAFDIKRGTEKLCRHFGVATLQGFGIRNDSPDIAAAGALLGYLEDTQKNAPPRTIFRRKIMLSPISLTEIR